MENGGQEEGATSDKIIPLEEGGMVRRDAGMDSDTDR